MKQDLWWKKGVISLKGLLTKSYLVTLIPLLIAVFTFSYISSKRSLWENFQLLKLHTENNILQSLSLVENGLKILAQSYDEQLKKDFEIFLLAYKKSGGRPELMDLDKIRNQTVFKADLFVIDQMGIVRYTTDKKDLGLDLSKIKGFWGPLQEKLRASTPPGYWGDFLTPETLTGKLKKYSYWATDDGKYILEMGLITRQMESYLALLDLGKVARDFEKFNPYLSKVEIFNSVGKFIEGNTQSLGQEYDKLLQSLDKNEPFPEIQRETDEYLIQYLYLKNDLNYGVLRTSKIVKLTYDKEKINKDLKNLAFIYLSVGLILILFTSIIISRTSSKLSLPIKKMVEDVSKISNGQYDIELVSFPIVELKTLESHIGLMVAKIKAQIQYNFQLSSELIKAQEEERSKIAKDLHDTVGQTLMAIKLKIQRLAKMDRPNNEDFRPLLDLMDHVSNELTEIYSGLYPAILDELGLESAIKWHLVKYLPEECQKSFQLNLKSPPDFETNIHLFRIIQEIFSNISKHSKAQEVTLRLFEDEKWIFLQISDNGLGFPPETKLDPFSGFGLKNIKHRVLHMGGEITLNSIPQQGTEFRIQVPKTSLRS